MAGDWIKMRPSLLTSPKVNGIARLLGSDPAVSRALAIGDNGVMNDNVTRYVMRSVTVASLLVIWGAANEHTRYGVFANADLSDLDDMVGIPGFGAAMEAVGWAEYDESENVVILRNFNEYNTCGKDRAAEKNAERQRRYRERKKKERNANGNVTNDVTNNDREEKRRSKEKIKKETRRFVKPTVDDVASYIAEKRYSVDPQRFIDFYESKGWMVGKNKMKDWKAAVRNWAGNNSGPQQPTQPTMRAL